MKVLMLVQSPVVGDARVVREADTLAMAGHDVTVVGRGAPEGVPAPGTWRLVSLGRAAGLGVSAGSGSGSARAHVVDAARWALLPQHVALVEARWAESVRRLLSADGSAAVPAPDVVHAHDLNTLGVGARIAAAHGAALVYDSHELWLDRPRLHRPTPFRDRRLRAQERRTGAGAQAVLTVGKGIADEFRLRYGWQHVHIVRNTFPAKDVEPLIGPPRGVLYAGRIAPYREIEVLAEAAERLAPLEVHAIGPADRRYLEKMTSGRLRIGGSRSVEEVDRLLRHLGLAAVTHSDRWLNHRLALPNKLFHAVRAGVPVIATDVGELGALVRRHELGVLYRPGDVDSMVRAVREAVDRYDELVLAVHRAIPEFSWERDAEVLKSVYEGLRRVQEAGR